MELLRWNLIEDLAMESLFSLSEGKRKNLQSAMQKGQAVVAVCDRELEAIPEEFFRLPYASYCITSGGKAIYDLEKGERVYVKDIPYQELEYVQYIAGNFPVIMEVLIDGRAVLTSSPEKIRGLCRGKLLSKTRLLNRKKISDLSMAAEKIRLHYDEKEKDSLGLLMFLLTKNTKLVIQDEGEGVLELFKAGASINDAFRYLETYIEGKNHPWITKN